MRNYPIHVLALLLVVPAAAAGAQSGGSPSAASSGSSAPPAGTLTKSPTATDVVETPLRVVNVKKPTIPEVLQRASEAPYSLAGLNSCKQLIAQIGQLNDALGEDIDVAHSRGHAFTAGHLAQSVVDSLIPFGGVIKEVSGAAAEQRRLQSAVLAGFARRGFLKGVGLSRKCPSPARPV